MIEVFKITHDIYDPIVSLKLAYHSGSITSPGLININLPITDFIMIYESTIFLHVLLISVTVYLTMSSMLLMLTYLRQNYTGFG